MIRADEQQHGGDDAETGSPGGPKWTSTAGQCHEQEDHTEEQDLLSPTTAARTTPPPCVRSP